MTTRASGLYSLGPAALDVFRAGHVLQVARVVTPGRAAQVVQLAADWTYERLVGNPVDQRVTARGGDLDPPVSVAVHRPGQPARTYQGPPQDVFLDGWRCLLAARNQSGYKALRRHGASIPVAEERHDRLH